MKARWDAAAERFASLQIPQWESDPFLLFVETLPGWATASSVLDVGCGAGRYAFALRERCPSVTGSDLSPNMIAFAQQKQRERQLDGLTFHCEDWNAQSSDALYDFVIAHRTPAIATKAGFEKMLSCGKQGGALSTFATFEDPIKNQFCKEHHLTSENRGSCVPLFFSWLWEAGLHPEIAYFTDDFQMEVSTSEEFLSLTALAIQNGKTELEAQNMAERFIAQHEDNGILSRPVHTIEIAMGWTGTAKK